MTGGRGRASGSSGWMTAVYSPKGGAGKTMLALNLATALGTDRPGSSLLVDLGLPYNHAALTAGLVPESCLALCGNAGDASFEDAVLDAVIRHPSGLLLLPATLRLEQSELITADLTERSLAVLLGAFDEVVVDLGVSLTETALRVLENADRIVLVLTPELAALKDAGELLKILRLVLGVPQQRLQLVLNHPRPASPVSRNSVERAIGQSLDFEIPHDGVRCDRAALTGELLMLSVPNSPVSKAIRLIADRSRRDRNRLLRVG
jgi:pilus assembly protein CpaE